MIKQLIKSFREGYQSARAPRRADGAPVHVSTDVASKRRQSVEATVIRACTSCGAPGAWSSSHEVNEKWPGVWVSATSNAAGWPIGHGKCPNCGMPRPQDKVLGEVWVKEFK